MLELVFVIVVIGILAAAIIPRMDRDTLYEASEQLLSHIKYTQHLAMTDNVYDDTDAAWFVNRWRIDLNNTTDSYEITNGTLNAVDPLTRDNIDGTGNYNLNQKYNAQIDTDYTLTFDHLGRPHSGVTGSVSDVMTTDLVITITANGETATVTVTPETGYSYITF